jgi:hypothetical protein
MKRLRVLLALFLFVSFILISCKKDDPPVASFTCDKTSGIAPLLVNFTSTSTGKISSYLWTFGDGGTATTQNPSHTYNDIGTYTAMITVTGPGGANFYNTTITVFGTDVTFNNPVFTNIYVTLNSITKTITPGSSVTFNSVYGSSVAYSAYTYGSTTSGTQVGLRMEWSGTLTLTGGTVTCNLNIPNTYFFIYMTNSGAHSLYNLYVNYGLVSETIDYITIANNSVKYTIGYYKAYTNSNVRMYWQTAPTSYSYWNQGTHFNLTWTNNQYVNLLNTGKSINIGTDNKSNIIHSQFSDITVSNVFPIQSFIYKKDPYAIDLYCK